LAPARPWPPRRHHLVVDPVLEDLAGNSVRRVFDRDLAGTDADDDRGAPGRSDLIGLPFEPRPT
jgi:hypothetical protein